MEGKKITIKVLEGLENQLLNAEASEGKNDIIIVIREELKEVQDALSYVRKDDLIINP